MKTLALYHKTRLFGFHVRTFRHLTTSSYFNVSHDMFTFMIYKLLSSKSLLQNLFPVCLLPLYLFPPHQLFYLHLSLSSPALHTLKVCSHWMHLIHFNHVFHLVCGMTPTCHKTIFPPQSAVRSLLHCPCTRKSNADMSGYVSLLPSEQSSLKLLFSRNKASSLLFSGCSLY